MTMAQDKVEATAALIQQFYTNKTVQQINSELMDSMSSAYASFDSEGGKRNMGLLLSLASEARAYQDTLRDSDKTPPDVLQEIINFYDVVDELMRNPLSPTNQETLIESISTLELAINQWLKVQNANPGKDNEGMHKSLLVFAKTMDITLERFFKKTWEGRGMRTLFSATAPTLFTQNYFAVVDDKHRFIKTIITQCTEALNKKEFNVANIEPKDVVSYLNEHIGSLSDLIDTQDVKLTKINDVVIETIVTPVTANVQMIAETDMRAKLDELQLNLTGLQSSIAMLLASPEKTLNRWELFLSYLGLVCKKTVLVNRMKEIETEVANKLGWVDLVNNNKFEPKQTIPEMYHAISQRMNRLKNELGVLEKGSAIETKTELNVFIQWFSWLIAAIGKMIKDVVEPDSTHSNTKDGSRQP